MFISILAILAGASVTADSARLIGDRVSIEPAGVSFQLPPYWRDSAYRAAHERAECGARASAVVYAKPALQRNELESPKGEWDKEFSAVADSVLSLDDLAIHIGAERWKGGSCFNDLQARVYVVGIPIGELQSRIDRIGRSTADRFFKSSFATADSGGWTIGRLSWQGYYYDYGGQARMEYYLRPSGDRTVVLLFMYVGGWIKTNLEDKKAILDSWR